ncbi:MAG: serine protease [Patescibacteria group bacterium]|jgi:hypothetical protein
MDKPELIKTIVPSVGLLVVSKTDGKATQLRTLGTGFLVEIDEEKFIVSNAHVWNGIPENDRPYVGILLYNGTDGKKLDSYTACKLDAPVVVDAARDLMLFRVSNVLLATPADLGNPDEMVAGGDVMFVGFPLADSLLQMGWGLTVTSHSAMISSVKRDANNGELSFFAVDKHSNPGLSGSPIASIENGEVIGIMSGHITNQSQTDPNFKISAGIAVGRPVSKEILRGLLVNLKVR